MRVALTVFLLSLCSNSGYSMQNNCALIFDQIPADLLRSLAVRQAFETLSQKPRKGWVDRGVLPKDQESVLTHLSQLAKAVNAYYSHSDPLVRERAVLMAWVHDLAEFDSPDYTPHDGISPQDKFEGEAAALEGLLKRVEIPVVSALIRELWLEYEHAETPMAKVVKQLDKADPAVQAVVYRAQGYPHWPEFLAYSLERIAEPKIRAALVAAQDSATHEAYATYFSLLE